MRKIVRHRLPPLPSIRELLRIYKIQASKALSQNFLIDPKLTSKIVRSAGKVRHAYVCEVGPGAGSITRSIIEQGAEHVTVIEKDRRFLPTLDYLAESVQGMLTIHIGDVLTFNMEHIFPKHLQKEWTGEPPRIHIIGNLPFNVSTPLIFKWLSAISTCSSAWAFGRVPMTLTFQKEVAERMIAGAGEPQRSSISVMCQNWCEVTHKFTIPGTAFIPMPEVDVGVVNFIPKADPIIPLDYSLVNKVVRSTLSMKRKYCQRGAGMLFPKGVRREMVDKLLKVADIDPTKRAIDLTMDDFRRLCYAYSAIIDQSPHLADYNVHSVLSDDVESDDVLQSEVIQQWPYTEHEGQV